MLRGTLCDLIRQPTFTFLSFPSNFFPYFFYSVYSMTLDFLLFAGSNYK